MTVSKILIGMVQPNTNTRFTTADVINSTYFAMDLQAVLNTVDNLPSKDIGTQSSSLISLLNQVNIPTLPVKSADLTFIEMK